MVVPLTRWQRPRAVAHQGWPLGVFFTGQGLGSLTCRCNNNNNNNNDNDNQTNKNLEVQKAVDETESSILKRLLLLYRLTWATFVLDTRFNRHCGERSPPS